MKKAMLSVVALLITATTAFAECNQQYCTLEAPATDGAVLQVHNPLTGKTMLEVSPGGRLCGPLVVYGDDGQYFFKIDADHCVSVGAHQ